MAEEQDQVGDTTIFFEDQDRSRQIAMQEALRVHAVAEQQEQPRPDPHAATMPVVVHNNMTPYFASARSQNTNDGVKDTRLRTFTGTDNDYHRSKREVEKENVRCLSEGATTVYGQPVQTDEERLRHFVAPVLHNNVNADPLANMRVGPGLGVGADVPSAGGFHPDSVLRVLPDNINAYRVNQLSALQANPGAAAVAAVAGGREAAGEAVRDVLPRFFEEKEHPPMPTNGVALAALAPSEPNVVRERATRRGIARVDLEDVAGTGVNALASRVAVGPVPAGAEENSTSREWCARPASGPAASMNPHNPPAPADFVMPYTGNRERCTPVANLNGAAGAARAPAPASTAAFTDAFGRARPEGTLRESCGRFAPGGAFVAAAYPATSDPSHLLGRQTLAQWDSLYPRLGAPRDDAGTFAAALGQAATLPRQLLQTHRAEYAPTALGGLGPRLGHEMSDYDDALAPLRASAVETADAQSAYRALSHGQGPQEYGAPVPFDACESRELLTDNRWRPPGQGRVLTEERGLLGEVELR